ncbi:lysosome-associated membrane glycoprotein 2 isoform X2 [Esox lucius]|uniref:Lysosomal-associated membrane protein 2 n=1 Tax=Esox lucius TaxID=8010 RepID=A0A3P8YYR0_ESOLU|nr:lysosome-associated membrane glycoprotein 2 isoform X2 [Esox lucius]
MSRCIFLVLFLALVNELHLSHTTEVAVNDKDNKLCLYANLMVNFSVTYEVTPNQTQVVLIVLPENVTTDGSTCENTTSTLKLNFGDGHSWAINFTKNTETYQADAIVFAYNLSDSSFFPGSVSNETKSVTGKPAITKVGVDTYYSCKSEVLTEMSVTQTLYDVALQAFVTNGSKSENETLCAADIPTTSSAPTTVVTPTAAPTSIPTPTPTLPTPATGVYKVVPGENSTACLMATFGLQLGYKQGQKEETINLVPNVTHVNGTCGVNVSDLVLTSDTINAMFTFTKDSNKFRLHGLNITITPATGVVFTASNTNLSLWEATVGSSYMCNKEQTYNVTDTLTLYTFELHIQPFGVKNEQFETAVECFMDSDLSFLVPIAVGVALSFLIILVLISYLIGRRKSRTGYQSV